MAIQEHVIPPQIFRFFLPLGNPLGFSVYDTIAFLAAAAIVAVFLWREGILAAANWIARRPTVAVLFTAGLPIALRLALLATHPVPTPTPRRRSAAPSGRCERRW